MKIKSIKLITLIFASIIGLTPLATLPTYADDYDVCSSNASVEVKKAAGCPGYDTGNQLKTVITNIIKAVIGISGLVAVVFVIIGGINYMTSGGDSSKIQKAKNTILYALIGILICALAFAIVNWTIGILK